MPCKESCLSCKETTIFGESYHRKKQVGSELECSMHYVADGSCVSVNFKTSGIGKGQCDLNNKTLEDIPDADENAQNPEFNHLYISFLGLAS